MQGAGAEGGVAEGGDEGVPVRGQVDADCRAAVGEALSKAGADLVYYKWENSPLQEDFFLRTNRYLVPVEVKASNGRSKSLRTLITGEYYPDIAWGVKLVRGNIGYENSILTLPLPTAFLLRRLLSLGDPPLPQLAGTAP